MEEELYSSADIKELAKALVAAQFLIQPVVRDSSNPYFNSRYAGLEAVWEAIREPLNKNNLCISQTLRNNTEGVTLITHLIHSASGQWIKSALFLRPVKSDPQAYGSAITYARRYTLMAIVGLPAEDDDGNAASGNDNPKNQNPKKQDPPPPDPDMAEKDALKAFWGAMKGRMEKWGIEDSQEIIEIYRESLPPVFFKKNAKGEPVPSLSGITKNQLAVWDTPDSTPVIAQAAAAYYQRKGVNIPERIIKDLPK